MFLCIKHRAVDLWLNLKPHEINEKPSTAVSKRVTKKHFAPSYRDTVWVTWPLVLEWNTQMYQPLVKQLARVGAPRIHLWKIFVMEQPRMLCRGGLPLLK